MLNTVEPSKKGHFGDRHLSLVEKLFLSGMVSAKPPYFHVLGQGYLITILCRKASLLTNDKMELS